MGELSVLRNTKQVVLPKPKNDIEDDPRYKLFSDKSLEELLENLVKYGKHSLYWMGDGWHCNLEVYVNTIGAELKVRSEFNNRTHKNAVIQCTIRLEETIEKIINTKESQ